MHIDVLGVKCAVSPTAFVPRTSQLVPLVSRHDTPARVVVTVDALPEQLERTISASSGRDRLGNPAFWIRSYLLINPALQALFISRSPIRPTQSLTRKVILCVLFNLGHGLVVEVRANHFQTSGSNVLTSKGTDSVVVFRALQHIKVPKCPTSIATIVTRPSNTLYPLVFRKVLWQFVLLRVLDGHTRDFVVTPLAVSLGSGSGVCANAREDTSRRLVHQTILIRQIIR